jgi:ATP-dependent exoDNAse (exonuclease V) alpha subunit
VRLDHRSLEAQQSELVPGRKIGVGRQRAQQPALPPHLEQRIAERRRIAQQNAEMILEDPTVAVRALAHRHATFTQHDIVQFLKSRTADARQLEAALGAILASSELVPLAEDPLAVRPLPVGLRFTSRDLLEAEKSLFKRVAAMTSRRRRSLPGGAPAPRAATAPTAPEHGWTAQQRRDFDCLVGEGDLAALAVAGGSLGPPLVAARLFWEAQGRKVSGIALSRARVEWLQSQAGISSQTLADRDAALQQDRALLTGDQVLIVDGAEMIGVKHLERLLAAADRARAKLVLLADADQLEALGAHSPIHSIIERVSAPHP